MSDFQMIPVDDLVRRHDARPLNDNALMELEDSVRRLGLLNPLTVRATPDGMFEVLAGAHRFAVCQAAGLHEIPCQVIDLDDIHAELAMIDENLARHQVTGGLLDLQLARRKAIYVELNPHTAHGAGLKKGADLPCRQVGDMGKPARFAAETAALMGTSERSVQRAVDRGEKIRPEAVALVHGTRLDTGTYREALKSIPAAEQVAKVQEDLAAPTRRPTPSTPSPKPKPTPGEAFTRFVDLATNMGKLLAKDIVAGLPAANRRADLRNHVRSLQDLLERVDEILEGGAA